MAVCTFCGSTIAKGTGLMYVAKEGKTFTFCSSKCKKNQLVLQRKPTHLKWTKRYAREHD